MTIKTSEEGRQTVASRWQFRTAPHPDVLAEQLAYDLSAGSLEKAEIIRQLPLFKIAEGDPIDEVVRACR